MNVSRRMEQKSAGMFTGKLLHQSSDLVKRSSYPQKLTICFRDTVDPKPQSFRKTDFSQKNHQRESFLIIYEETGSDVHMHV